MRTFPRIGQSFGFVTLRDSVTPSLSVVIPTRLRPEELERCLEALTRQDCEFHFETLVIDNSAGDRETEMAAARWGARYVVESLPGLCRARNRGALEATGEIIAYLDDDSIPEPGWAAEIVRAFENDTDIMGAAGRVLPLRVETESEKIFASVRGKAYDRDEPLKIDRANQRWFEITGFGGIGPGSNMAFRRLAFADWRGFNERTDRGTPLHGGGDQHAFFSLVALGHSVAYVPAAIVKHPLPQSMRELEKRYLDDLTASAGYFTMLLVEQSGYRLRTLRYLLGSVSGKPRTWRGQSARRPVIGTASRRLLALARGPIRYLIGRLDRRPDQIRLRS